jgi:hypothetical protein
LSQGRQIRGSTRRLIEGAERCGGQIHQRIPDQVVDERGPVIGNEKTKREDFSNGLFSLGVVSESQLVNGPAQVSIRSLRKIVESRAVVGGSIGLAAGFSFPFFGRGTSLKPTVGSSPRTFITASEVAEAAANTAYEVVRLLRPNWLASRRPTLVADQTCRPSDLVCEPIAVDGMRVYLDGHRLGGESTLMEISAQNIETIRYFGPAEAVARWGAGNGQGAILVNTIG